MRVPAVAAAFGKSVAEVRRALGFYVDPEADTTAPRVSVPDAIMAEDRLLPEAKDHLLRQFELLLRVQPLDPDEVESRRMLAEHRKSGRSVPKATPKRRT